MFEFLGWLWSVAQKQFAWFGPEFWDFITKVRNVAIIVWQLIAQSLQPVYSTVSQGLSDIWGRTTIFVGGVQVTLIRYASGLQAVAINEIGLLGQRFEENLRLGMNVIQAAIKAVQDTFTAIINSWIGLTQVMIADVVRQWTGFQAAIGPRIEALLAVAVSPVRIWLTERLTAFQAIVHNWELIIGAVRKDTAILTERAKGTIVALVSDPIGFVLAALVPILVDVLCQVIAEKLGAAEDVIPSRPSWSTPRPDDTAVDHLPPGAGDRDAAVVHENIQAVTHG